MCGPLLESSDRKPELAEDCQVLFRGYESDPEPDPAEGPCRTPGRPNPGSELASPRGKQVFETSETVLLERIRRASGDTLKSSDLR